LEEGSFLIPKAFEAFSGKIRPNIESETIQFKVLFGHVFFIEKDLLPVTVVEGPFVGV
jgi:hypothetical protein